MQLNTRYKENFKDRHIGASADEVSEMLKVVGVNSLDELVEQTLPKSIILDHELNTSARVSEQQFLTDLKEIASKNKIFKSYIGMGYYNTFTPGVILRNIMENPGWYTQYTPYQAEIAQGRLEALLNFQTAVIDLTGMEIANASLLDEATAAAEAMHMFYGLKDKDQGEKFFISELTFPQTIDVFRTRAEAIGIELVIGNYKEIELNSNYFGAYIQYPDNNGNINIYKEFCDDAHSVGVKVAVGADLMSLVLLAPPAEFGADAVVGTTQRFGIPLGYGGPHAAYFATKEEYKRQLPGRIIGVSIDRNGNRALRMALQTREQHIRREKATSNICTAQVLLAIMAGAYAAYHGPEGLKKIAGRIHGLAKVLDKGLNQLGYRQINTAYFDTIKIDAEGLSTEIKSLSKAQKINFRYFNDNKIGISIDETTSPEDVQVILNIFAEAKGVNAIAIEPLEQGNTINWDQPFIRKSEFLTHEVFNKYHSEHEMLRYLKHLENKDLSLAHSMISLGSCTMKLNATTEMIPVTWPEFNQLHPFVPLNQAEGYLQMFEELERDLAEITGFSGTSLQPNAGAQGEYTGLLVIRKYFESIGQSHRDIAIIPQSAHGTNPASAVMAGMKVVVVKTDDKGNIDIDDLKVKAEQHAENLACLMITYPSTHGVFEEGVKDMTAIIHDNGGQVYMDGANMNAQVGITNPGMIGADVCHLNLHKTFCIPHGGGGPGMGPICVAKHLVPFLPGHSLVKTGGYNAIPPVSAAPWGSASILVISYAYIKMMGTKGLTEATKTAILNANYMKARLSEHFKTLYEGKNGRVAHEMIVDTREFKNTAGVEVEDIAKRLIDYGFHAPTVSFPVAGTLMIEPTESESKEELDKFCDALISIKAEIDEIISGKADKDDNVLKNAPHTVIEVTADTWEHKYSRQQAAYPANWVVANKFWPSVARVNNTHGDRNLICSCPPLESYEEVVA